MDEGARQASVERRRLRTKRILALLGALALVGLAMWLQASWQLAPAVNRLYGRAAYRGEKADRHRARAGGLIQASTPGASPVLITEVSADNRDVILDEDLAPSDWIELYNRSEQPVPLAGWRLVEAGRPRRGWAFPAISIAPRSYLIVWASGKDRVSSAAGRRVNTVVTGEIHLRHEVNDLHLPLPGGVWKIARASNVEVNVSVPGRGRYALWVKASAEGLSGTLRVRVPGSRRRIVTVPGGRGPRLIMIGSERGFPLEGVGPHAIEISAVSGAVHVEHLAFVRPGPLEDRYAPQVHTNFRLKQGREPVMLVDAWGVVRDETPVPDNPPARTLQRDPETLAWRVGLPTPAGQQFYPGPDLANYPSLSPTPIAIVPARPPGVEEIRYTRDGSIPTMDAPRLEGPLRVIRPTALRLRGYSGGAPVTPIVTRQFWIGPPPSAPTLMLALDRELINDPEIGIELNDRWRRRQDLPDDPALGPLQLTRRRDWARVRRQWLKPADLLALDSTGVLFDGRARVRRFTTAVGPGFGWHLRTLDPLYPVRDVFRRPLAPAGRSILVDEDDLNVPSYDMVRAAGGIAPLTEWGLFSVNGAKPSWRVLLESVDDDFLRSRWGHTNFDLLKGKPFSVKHGTVAAFDAHVSFTTRRGLTAADVAPLMDLPPLMALHFTSLFMTMGTGGEYWQTDFVVDHERRPPQIHAIGWDLDHAFEEEPSHDTLAAQRAFASSTVASQTTERGPVQIMQMLLTLLDTDPAFRQTYLRYAERTLNHVLTPAWWEARRRAMKGRISPDRVDTITRFFRERPPYFSASLAKGLGLPPPHVVRVEVQGEGRLTIDGYPQQGPYEGRYFEGGVVELAVPLESRGALRDLTVNGRREPGPVLRAPVSEDLQIVVRFGG